MTRAELLIFNLGYILVLSLGYEPETDTQNLQLDKAATSTAKSLAIYNDIFVSNSNLCKNKNYKMKVNIPVDRLTEQVQIQQQIFNGPHHLIG